MSEELSQRSLPPFGVAAQTLADAADEPYGEGQNDEEIEEEPGADEYQHGGEDDDIQRSLADGEDAGQHAPFDVGEVVAHAADDVAFAL